MKTTLRVFYCCQVGTCRASFQGPTQLFLCAFTLKEEFCCCCFLYVCLVVCCLFVFSFPPTLPLSCIIVKAYTSKIGGDKAKVCIWYWAKHMWVGAFAWHLGMPLLREMWFIDCLCEHSMNCYVRPMYGLCSTGLHLNWFTCRSRRPDSRCVSYAMEYM